MKDVKKKLLSKSSTGNQKGLVILEAIPIIWIMFVLMGATLGSWGIVHTAVLHSIAARNYIFFTFNNRADLSYLRDFSNMVEYPGAPIPPNCIMKYYREKGKRFAYINKENPPSGSRDVFATIRPVSFGENLQYTQNSGDFLTRPVHPSRIYSQVPHGGKNKRRDREGKAWIMVGYGICLSARCN